MLLEERELGEQRTDDKVCSFHSLPPSPPSLSMRPEMPNLPDDINFDLLSRLPIVSLCRFRCVSKTWRSLISHPDFITAHLNRSTKNQNDRLILLYEQNLYSVDFDSSQSVSESVAVPLKFPAEQNPDDWGEICGSCNGLLLIGSSRFLDQCFHQYLVNPATRESRKLPECPFRIKPGYSFNDYGFGYDSSRDDYKVVNIGHHDAAVNLAYSIVSVYTLRYNSWRRVENSPYCHTRFGQKSGVFVAGALHWMVTTGIAAFDLVDEKFWTVPSPGPVDEIGVLRGCLCVLVVEYPNCVVGVMNEYGVRDSWTKFTVPYSYWGESWRPLSLSRTGEVLLQVKVKRHKLVLFDPQEEKYKEVVVHGRPTHFEAGTCMESLVSPKRQRW